jgi:hypothetical protein
MSIANAVQRDGYVYVYDESGSQIAAIPFGSVPGDGLTGYTSTTINIKMNGSIYTYNEQGSIINSMPA